MDVGNVVDTFGLEDVDAVDEVTRFDQHAIQIHGVVRRNPEIATGYTHLDGTGFDADRQHAFAPR